MRKYIKFGNDRDTRTVIFLDSIASIRKELSNCVVTTVGGHEYEIKHTVEELIKLIEDADK